MNCFDLQWILIDVSIVDQNSSPLQNIAGTLLMTSNASVRVGGPCCPCQSRNSTCSRCICVRSRRKCTSCRTLSRGTCKNGSRNTVVEIVDPVNEIADSVTDTVDPSPICGESVESNSVAFDDFIDAKLTQAFDASILRSDGGSFVDPWGTWWIRACRMSGRQYDLPGEAVGREFVDLLTTEVRLLTDNCYVRPSDDVLPSDTTEKSYGESWF